MLEDKQHKYNKVIKNIKNQWLKKGRMYFFSHKE